MRGGMYRRWVPKARSEFRQAPRAPYIAVRALCVRTCEPEMRVGQTYGEPSNVKAGRAQHFFDLSPSTPSFAMIGTMTSPATGSAHHQPTVAFRSKPPNRIADKYVQKSVCLESACIAALPRPRATRRLALARRGMTTSETVARTMPGMVRPALGDGSV